MTPEQQQQAQLVISDVQMGLAALQPFTALTGVAQPGVQLTIGLVNAGLTALKNAIATGTDITEAQLAAIKQGEQASIDDDLQAQRDAWDKGDRTGNNPYLSGTSNASTQPGSSSPQTAAQGPAQAAIQGLRPANPMPIEKAFPPAGAAGAPTGSQGKDGNYQ